MLSLEQAQQEIQNIMDTVMLYQHRRPLFTRLGRVIHSDSRMNFRNQRSPDGTPWAPLRMRSGQILSDTGRLRNSLTYQVGNDEVQVGTNVKYARTHQFGATIKPKKAKALAFPGGEQPGQFGFAEAAGMTRHILCVSDQVSRQLIGDGAEGFVKHCGSPHP